MSKKVITVGELIERLNDYPTDMEVKGAVQNDHGYQGNWEWLNVLGPIEAHHLVPPCIVLACTQDVISTAPLDAIVDPFELAELTGEDGTS